MNKTKYIYPVDVIEMQLRQQAWRRHEAFKAHGCASYVMGSRGPSLAIVCLGCGLGSCNINDIEKRYCGFCHVFHNEWSEDLKGGDLNVDQ